VNEQVRAAAAVKTELMARSGGVRIRVAWRRIALSAAVLAAGTAGLGLGAAGSATAASKTLEGVPRLGHVFVIVLENEDYNATWGPTSPAKYLKSLVPHGVLATNYYGVSHASADNYIAMTSGQAPEPQFQADCPNWEVCEASQKVQPDGGRSIADQLTANHVTWGAYMESMATPCQHPSASQLSDPYQTGYATRHDPFVYYPPIVENTARCDAHVRPYSELARALPNGAVPEYIFITPDTCDDGHDATCPNGQPGGLPAADRWLSANVPLILGSPAYRNNGALLITFDEASTSDNSGCCATGIGSNGSNGGGRIGLLMLSPQARAGHATDAYYDHNSLLRTTEDAFGVGEHLNNAGSSKVHPMSDLFRR
jgi:phosphatidylinositol-3-phosphatase